VKKLKQVSSKIGDGIHATPEYVDSSDFYFINGNNLNEGVITISESTKSVSEEEFEKYKLNLNYGTVLISINGTIGNLAIYQGENIILGKSACYIELLKNLESRHLYYQLQTEFTLNAIETSLSGTTIKNLSLGTVRNLKILLPPLPEQAAIVDYIETETAKINEKMTVARQEIALLKEFRQALIFECVTGKVCCLEEKIDL
jgi:type I restriction enzyme S subunit